MSVSCLLQSLHLLPLDIIEILVVNYIQDAEENDAAACLECQSTLSRFEKLACNHILIWVQGFNFNPFLHPHNNVINL